MASYYACMLNDNNGMIDASLTEKALEPVKDWLRFSRNNYIVYTDLSAAELRDLLKDTHKAHSPDVLVIKNAGDEWAVFANKLVREWMHRDRSERQGQ